MNHWYCFSKTLQGTISFLDTGGLAQIEAWTTVFIAYIKCILFEDPNRFIKAGDASRPYVSMPVLSRRQRRTPRPYLCQN